MKGSEEQWMLVKDSGAGKAVLRDYEKKRERLMKQKTTSLADPSLTPY